MRKIIRTDEFAEEIKELANLYKKETLELANLPKSEEKEFIKEVIKHKIRNKEKKVSNKCFNLINPIVTILANQFRVKVPFRVNQESRQCLAALGRV